MAELDFGKETMDAYRRSADRVGEPVQSFELSPGRVEPRPLVAVPAGQASQSLFHAVFNCFSHAPWKSRRENCAEYHFCLDSDFDAS